MKFEANRESCSLTQINLFFAPSEETIIHVLYAVARAG